MDKEATLKAAADAAAKRANGEVLRTINVLSGKFIDLKVLCSIEEGSGMKFDEIMEALNYLMLAGYIQIRRIDTKINADLADVSYKECEARLSAEGLSLLRGETEDGMVEV